MSHVSDKVARPDAYEGPVPVAEQEHYDQLRQVRGWSWETLAAYFESQRSDPASPRLAEWARGQVEAKPSKSKRGSSAEPEKRG